MLLSLSAAGPEFRINTFTTVGQNEPAIAMDGDGDFVGVWASFQDGSSQGIYAQRYNAAGVPQGAESRVNTHTPNLQFTPAVAMDVDGDFVLAWHSVGQDGSSFGVYAQRYNAAGVAQSQEFRVNSYILDAQHEPAVAMNAAGDFVIAWQSRVQEGQLDYGIFAQRYEFAGEPLGDEFRVNTFTTNNQGDPAVAMDADGDFVVTWTSYGQDGSGYGIYAQRYNSTGTAQGGEFRANTFTTGEQGRSAVAMDASGRFVVAWESVGQDGSLGGIFAQRYDASGVPQGGEFQVNVFTTADQRFASVAMDVDGDFVVAWDGYGQDGSGFGIRARAYNAAGVAQGGELSVNSYTTADQRVPVVAMDARGDAVIDWQSNGQDGSGYGVYAQRYAESNPDAAAPMVGGVFVNGTQVRPYSVHRPTVTQIVVSFSENMTDAGGPGGANSVTNPANWLITRNGIDLTPGLTITYGFNPAANRFEAVLNLPSPFNDGNFLLKARDNLRDIAGNRLDGNLDGVAGGNLLLPFSVASGSVGAQGGEFRVNTFTANRQLHPSAAMDASGDFVVAWQSFNQDFFGYSVFAQRYNAAGVPQGGEFRVNTFTPGDKSDPSVAIGADGDFVIAWTSSLQDGSGDGVYAQRYNAAGVTQGGEFRVNTSTSFDQSDPSVAMDATGDFVVAWESNDGFDDGVYAQRYTAAGAPQGGEFRVNTVTDSIQRDPSVAMDASGDFVVAWHSYFQDGSGYGIYAQRYNSTGAAQGGEFRVNTFTPGEQGKPSVAMDASGRFVVAWESDGQDGSLGGIFAQRYSTSGVPQGGEFQVNVFTTADQRFASVAMDLDGDFVVAWDSYGQDGSGFGIRTRAYNAAGVAQGGELPVNSYTTSDQRVPVVAMDASGDFVVAWQSYAQDGSNLGVYAQRYGPRNTPTVGTLSDIPDPVTGGNSFTLSASGVVSNGRTVSSISFYRESNGEPGLQVGAEGDTFVGTTNSNIGGFWSVNVSTVGLPAGTYTYWAQATDDTGLTGAPASTTNTVIIGAPAVSATSFLFNTLPQRITFTFDQNVGASLSLADFVVQKLPAGPIVTPDSLSYDSGTNTATLSFNTPLPDGNYRATALAAGITNSGGTPMAADVIFNFFFLNGDANHDGRVNLSDFNILAANFGQSNRNFSQGDFNYDTIVNLIDFNLLASRFGQMVAPASVLEEIGGDRETDVIESLRNDVLA